MNIKQTLYVILQKMKTLSVKTDTHISSFYFYKRGKIVTCVSNVPSLLNPTSQWGTLGTLPQEYCPSKDVQAPCLWGKYANVTGLIQIKTDGTVNVYASSQQSSVQPWTAFAYSVD